MSAMASQITSIWLFAQSFIQTYIKENVKAPRHWPLWGEVHRWLVDSHHKGPSNAEKFSIWWRHHDKMNMMIFYNEHIDYMI